jgi:hypothetical protein
VFASTDQAAAVPVRSSVTPAVTLDDEGSTATLSITRLAVVAGAPSRGATRAPAVSTFVPAGQWSVLGFVESGFRPLVL